VVQEIPAEWLPVRCETKRPTGDIGRDCRARARNFYLEPSEVKTSLEPGIANAQSSVWRILRKRLRAKGYWLQLLQALNPQVQNLRFQFCMDFQQWLEEDGFAEKLLFSDEATVHVCGKVNRHKVRTWGTENPHATVEHVPEA
jgi:hypothetical protein